MKNIKLFTLILFIYGCDNPVKDMKNKPPLTNLSYDTSAHSESYCTTGVYPVIYGTETYKGNITEKRLIEPMHMVGNKVDLTNKDTGIYQLAHYQDGKYWLQTYVQTEDNQLHIPEWFTGNFNASGYEEYVPYNRTISGTFNFIKNSKAKEYEKAEEFIFNTYHAYPDSVNMLNNYIDIPDCCYNICIGRYAGLYLRNEKYCVIVGSDSASTNVYGRNMIWQVDFEHPLLSKKQKKELKLYYKKWVVTGKDNIKSRIEFVKKFGRIKG